jgi:hypothetical protein
MDVGAALHADLVERRTIEADALLAAAIALEHLGAEPAGRPPARGALDALRTWIGPGPLGAAVSTARRVVAVTAAVLIAAVFVFAIVAHLTHLANK